MKIKIIEKPYEEVMRLPQPERRAPKRMNLFFRLLTKTVSAFNLARYRVKYVENGMEELPKKTPCLVLMNHSSFIDMQLAANYLFPRPFSTVCTTDAYVGQTWLMRQIGCIPTQKFISDVSLLKDISYAINELGSTVLLYPEAGYSFDGTATTLPDSLGKLCKLLKVPVITMITHGAFLREPLYNMLRHRKVKISVDVTYRLSPEEIERLTTDELNARIRAAFSFDDFRRQQEEKIAITEDFRADGLERVLYRCPHCQAEGKTVGKGIRLICESCGATYELTEHGFLKATKGETLFSHMPDWYAWEREQVRKELLRGDYLLDIAVEIYMLVDYKGLYHVGEGRLVHNEEGFHLTGCGGAIDYSQSPTAAYSLNADYYWYEIGDVISIGNKRQLFYCFPKNTKAIVAKARLAAEELYKLKSRA